MFHFSQDLGAYPLREWADSLASQCCRRTIVRRVVRRARRGGGRVGCIIPTAIATGAGGQYLFGELARRGGVASLYDFDNRKPLFPSVHADTSSAVFP